MAGSLERRTQFNEYSSSSRSPVSMYACNGNSPSASFIRPQYLTQIYILSVCVCILHVHKSKKDGRLSHFNNFQSPAIYFIIFGLEISLNINLIFIADI